MQPPSPKPVSYVVGLFKSGNGKKEEEEEAEEPFVCGQMLQDYCSLFAADCIPNNIRDDPHLAETIKFSDDELSAIAQNQTQRQIQRQEEEKKKENHDKLEHKLKNKHDTKVDKILHWKGFFLKKQCPVKIPFKSSLSHEEHAAYLRTFLKLKDKEIVTTRQTAEYDNYMRLQHRVYEEQSNFMQFSFQVATALLQNYNAVPEPITKYIDQYLQGRCSRALRYREHYIMEQQIPICPQDPEKNLSTLSFKHLGHVLSLGTLPQFVVPHVYKSHKLKIDDEVSKAEHLAQTVVHDDNELHDKPVSADRNANYLAHHHKANIVISTSALKVLADNHAPNFDKEWDIPVLVKSYVINDADGRQTQHRVVYVDKPLPKKVWTPLEKKQVYYKKASLANFTKTLVNKCFRLPTPPVFSYVEPKERDCSNAAAAATAAGTRLATQYDDDIFDYSHATDTDVFGNQSVDEINPTTLPKKCASVKRKLISQSDVCNDAGAKAKGSEAVEKDSSEHSHKIIKPEEIPENDPQNLLESLLCMQDSLLKPLHSQGDDTEDRNKESSPPSKAPPRPWDNKLHTQWNTFFEPHVCRPWTGKNVHYHLFSLGPDANSQPNNFLHPLRILVRSNLHGLSYFRFEKGKCKAYVCHPKVENQAYFGCEVNTLTEVTQQWVQLLVRPNTSLLQIRVCEDSGDVLMTEEKDLSQVLKDGKQQHVGFSCYQPLATFYSVFSALLGQPTGHYLLHHGSKTKAFMQLMKATDQDKDSDVSIYNLHKAYTSPSVTTRTYTVAPWLAIDTHVLTPFHKKHQKIPGTFPMNNPNKKLTPAEKKKKISSSKSKKSLQDLDKQMEEETSAF